VVSYWQEYNEKVFPVRILTTHLACCILMVHFSQGCELTYALLIRTTSGDLLRSCTSSNIRLPCQGPSEPAPTSSPSTKPVWVTSLSHSNWSLKANSFEKENMKSLNLELSRWTWNPKAIQVHCTILIEFNSMKKYKLTNIESFITKHVPIIEHFAIFLSSLNQIKQFLCHWICKLEDYKWHKNGMLLLFSLSPTFSSFWVLFWVI